MATRIEKEVTEAGKRIEEEVRRLIDEMIEIVAEKAGKRELLKGFDDSFINFCATKIVYDMLMKGLPSKFDDYIMYR